MEIDRKDTNIQIGKRLREARTNMNKDKAEFAATLDVVDALRRGLRNTGQRNGHKSRHCDKASYVSDSFHIIGFIIFFYTLSCSCDCFPMHFHHRQTSSGFLRWGCTGSSLQLGKTAYLPGYWPQVL